MGDTSILSVPYLYTQEPQFSLCHFSMYKPGVEPSRDFHPCPWVTVTASPHISLVDIIRGCDLYCPRRAGCISRCSLHYDLSAVSYRVTPDRVVEERIKEDGVKCGVHK